MELGFNPQVSPQGHNRQQKLQDLSKKFEAVLMSQAFSTMRDTVPKDGLVDTGSAGDLYNSMLDRQVASMGSEKGGLGLGQALYAYLEQGLAGDKTQAEPAKSELDTRG